MNKKVIDFKRKLALVIGFVERQTKIGYIAAHFGLQSAECGIVMTLGE